MKPESQKIAYAMRRMSQAVDRVIVLKCGHHWVNAWAKRAKIKNDLLNG